MTAATAVRHELAPDCIIHQGNVLDILPTLPDAFVQTVCTSPPYWGLRDYGAPGQLGLEPTPEEYVANMVAVFREVRRILRPDGTLWLNLGDCYARAGGTTDSTALTRDREMTHMATVQNRMTAPPDGLKPKDLVGIPWQVAFALQADGWYLRSALPWIKPNPMPESITDRPGTAHEYIFLLTKSERYFYDKDAVAMPGTLQTEKALSFKRDGKHSELLLPGQGYAQHRPDREDAPKKQDGHGRRHAGFNARWDAAEAEGSIPPTRNRRTSDWWNESIDEAIAYHIAEVSRLVHARAHGGLLSDEEGMPEGFMVSTQPFEEAHFAVWPPKLVTPMILAGTSPHACPHCGAPWERQVEKERTFESGSGKSGNPISGKNGDKIQGGGATGDIRKGPTVHTKTVGWQPTCSCEANDGSGQCWVLDPFHGSGTTGLVALENGRAYQGCELNPAYIEISRRRLQKGQTKFAL